MLLVEVQKTKLLNGGVRLSFQVTPETTLFTPETFLKGCEIEDFEKSKF